MYDIDYEINKYIDEQADCYVSFHDLLKQNHLTFEKSKAANIQFLLRRMESFTVISVLWVISAI